MILSSICLLALVNIALTSLLPTAVKDISSTSTIYSPVPKRQGSQNSTLLVPLDSGFYDYGGGGYYFVTLDVGTPPQSMKLLVDTGSSDFWVYGSSLCEMAGGCFNQSQSTTAKSTELQELIAVYGGQGGVTSAMFGSYITDTVDIGGVVLENVTLGVVQNGTIESAFAGILGLGYDRLQDASLGLRSRYPSLLDVLYATGHINSHTYGVYLDSIEAATGSLLFGGYDQAKFTGSLVGLSRNSTDSIPNMSVSLLEVFITDESGTTNEAGRYPAGVSALLDTGTPLASSLPNQTYMNIVQHLANLGYNFTQLDSEYPVVDCGLRAARGSIDLTFADIAASGADRYSHTVIISVPFSELAVPQTESDGSIDYCNFGINNKTSGPSGIFGDTFLRSMYVVYDLDSNIIALAQSKFNVAESEIVAIG